MSVPLPLTVMLTASVAPPQLAVPAKASGAVRPCGPQATAGTVKICSSESSTPPGSGHT